MSSSGKDGGNKTGKGRGQRWPGPGAGSRKTAGPTAPRMIAIRVVERVQRAGAYADLTLHHALVQSRIPAADRALATELVYGTLRWRGRLDYLIAKALDRDLTTLEPLVTSALRVGAYQLFFSDRIPANAAVDEAVRCVRAMGLERATGLVNAVLRRLAREGDQIELPKLEDDPLDYLVHAGSLPQWLAKRWLAQFGPEEAAKLAQTMNQPAPVAIRVNRTKTNREAILPELRERFPEAELCRYAPDGIILGRKGDAGHDPAFVSGHFSIQDEASQLVVDLLDPQPGERILDTCSAPGTKSASIAERLDGEGYVLALDRHPRRLHLVGRGIRRLGLGGVATLERDATKSLEDLATEAGPFDRILVDAPCSGLGSLRRNPDARWRVRPDDLEALGKIQRALLESAAAVLRPGGSLVYSTCTITPEENELVIKGFMATRKNWEIAPAGEAPDPIRKLIGDDGFLRLSPHHHDMDGFFAVRLIRGT
ncbi:MAG: 16S rRNA (cytosine(967)-C(5))-methyltransferase RsmB [Myxococcales bacterium]|nr:16S rRNA (cytosine(967)-C(5))-methyltransferase RsmB [Myxococcales bacterium]HIK85391.1 16S rRNA (cytosine(967)-C(5))-methyltransferase RsmB [Myxococcales bacterium]